MATAYRETLVSYIAAGYTAAQIAARFGVTPEAVLETMKSDTRLEADVVRVTRYKKIDATYDSIEEIASRRLAQAVAFESDTMKLLKIASGINAMKRRSSSAEVSLGNESEATRYVKLAMPKRLEVKYETTSNNEVISVDDRSLVSMPAQQLLKQERSKQPELEHKNGHLPREMPEDITDLL